MLSDSIDLTENRVFSQEFHDVTLNLLKIDISGKKPWNMPEFRKISSDKDLMNYRPLIFLGDKEERYRLKEADKGCDANYCDCCGKFLGQKPWKLEECICEDCLNKMNQRYTAPFPWFFKESLPEMFIF